MARAPKAGSPAAPKPALPTAAEAVRLIDGWSDLKSSRQQDLRASVVILSRVYKQPLDRIRMDPEDLERRYVAAAIVACGIAASSFVTYRASLRAVLRRLQLIEQPRRSTIPLQPAWARLRAALPDRLLSLRLQTFMAFCNELGLTPDAVTDHTLDSFYDLLTSRRLTKSPSQETRLIATSWNLAGERIPNWPRTILTAANRSRCYSPPFSAYPAACQADIEAFRQRLSPASTSSLFASKGPRRRSRGVLRPLKPNAINTRMSALRMALAALVLTGRDIASIRSLTVLVEPDNLRAVIDWHWNRAGQKVTDHTGAISDTLRVVAKYHVGLQGHKLAEALDIVKQGKPRKRSRMTEKNELRLAQFDDNTNLACLLHLPGRIMQDAEELLAARQHQPAAWLAGVAVAIEIELHCPMRIYDLANLRLGESLLKLDHDHCRWTHFVTQTSKTGVMLNWPIAVETAAMIELYVQQYRPYLSNHASKWLFPSRDHPDRPRFGPGLSKSISVTIYQLLGLDVNTHFFRVIAAALLLEDNPGALEDLRNLLGHNTMHTALTYYASRQQKVAANLLATAVFRRREDFKPLAMAAFARSGKTYKWGKVGGPGSWS